MRYALIREMDISNGEGVGVSLFVQGCHFHCPGCFNQEEWDFNGGKEWTEDVKNNFFELIDRPFIKRVSFLGGEPLADENAETVYELIQGIKSSFPDKKIWVYTGYSWDAITSSNTDNEANFNRTSILQYIDVLVDGQFQLDKQDINHKQIKFAGSTNQRIIDVKQSLKQNEVVLLRTQN